jgi:hypothetical protein
MLFIVTNEATLSSRQKRPAAGGGRHERRADEGVKQPPAVSAMPGAWRAPFIVADFACGTTTVFSPLLPSAPLMTITSLQSQ